MERVYRPASFLRLFIRLDDFKQPTAEELLDVQSESSPFKQQVKQADTKLKRLKEQRASAGAASATGSPDGTSAAILDKKIRTAEQEKAKLTQSRRGNFSESFVDQLPVSAQTLSPGDDHSIEVIVVPTELDVDLNSFRIADTITASFPFRDAPFVSEIIRAALVEAYVGTVTAESFGKPESWRLPLDVDKEGGRARLMFRGYVDEWETSHGDDDATVSIKARSYEAVMIDAKINPRAPAYKITGSGEKISAYVNRILGQFPQTSGKFGDQFRAAWYGSPPEKEPILDRGLLLRSLQTAASRNAALSGGGSPQTPAPAAAQQDTGGTADGQENGSALGDPRMNPKSPGQEMSLWDLITQACELSGCLPVYDPSLPVDKKTGVDPKNFLLLRPPQTIFRRVDGGVTVIGGPADEFGRFVIDPVTKNPVLSQVRFMVWGHNIKSMKTSRKLGRIKAPAVEVISLNPDAPPKERTIRQRFPPDAHISRMGAKGEGKVDEVKTVVVRGIRKKDALMQIAVSIYHQLSRQELSVQIETDEMASYIDPSAERGAFLPGSPVVPAGKDHNDDPDLLRLRPGSPCRVTVAREHRTEGQGKTLVISPLSEVFEKRREQIAKMLREQAGRFHQKDAQTEKFTDRIMTALGAAKLQDVFYCRSAKHRFTADDGYSVSMELVNYIEAYSDSKNLGAQSLEADEERREDSVAERADADKDAEERRKKAEEAADLVNRGIL